MNTYYVYIMTNKGHNVLYIGVTNDLIRRVAEHKSGEIEGFTKKYRVRELAYCESYSDVKDAIHREKQLKRWSHAKKVSLIEGLNPEWRDLSEEQV